MTSQITTTEAMLSLSHISHPDGGCHRRQSHRARGQPCTPWDLVVFSCLSIGRGMTQGSGGPKKSAEEKAKLSCPGGTCVIYVKLVFREDLCHDPTDEARTFSPSNPFFVYLANLVTFPRLHSSMSVYTRPLFYFILLFFISPCVRPCRLLGVVTDAKTSTKIVLNKFRRMERWTIRLSARTHLLGPPHVRSHRGFFVIQPISGISCDCFPASKAHCRWDKCQTLPLLRPRKYGGTMVNGIPKDGSASTG